MADTETSQPLLVDELASLDPREQREVGGLHAVRPAVLSRYVADIGLTAVSMAADGASTGLATRPSWPSASTSPKREPSPIQVDSAVLGYVAGLRDAA